MLQQARFLCALSHLATIFPIKSSTCCCRAHENVQVAHAKSLNFQHRLAHFLQLLSAKRDICRALHMVDDELQDGSREHGQLQRDSKAKRELPGPVTRRGTLAGQDVLRFALMQQLVDRALCLARVFGCGGRAGLKGRQ
jgi:hypothetical protein